MTEPAEVAENQGYETLSDPRYKDSTVLKVKAVRKNVWRKNVPAEGRILKAFLFFNFFLRSTDRSHNAAVIAGGRDHTARNQTSKGARMSSNGTVPERRAGAPVRQPGNRTRIVITHRLVALWALRHRGTG